MPWYDISMYAQKTVYPYLGQSKIVPHGFTATEFHENKDAAEAVGREYSLAIHPEADGWVDHFAWAQEAEVHLFQNTALVKTGENGKLAEDKPRPSNRPEQIEQVAEHWLVKNRQAILDQPMWRDPRVSQYREKAVRDAFLANPEALATCAAIAGKDGKVQMWMQSAIAKLCPDGQSETSKASSQ